MIVASKCVSSANIVLFNDPIPTHTASALIIIFVYFFRLSIALSDRCACLIAISCVPIGELEDEDSADS